MATVAAWILGWLPWLFGASLVAETESAAHGAWPSSEIEGRFGVVVDIPVHAELSWLGGIDYTYHTIILAEVRELDGRILQRHDTCGIELLEETPIADLDIDWEETESLRMGTYPVDIEGRRYRADLGIRYVGLVEGFAGPLPDRPDDRGVIDDDHDGEPGVTLHVRTPLGGMRVFLVQRDHPILEGRIVSTDYIVGGVGVPLLEQQVLGTSPPLPRPESDAAADPRRARFEMFRIPDDVDCQELAQTWPSHRDQALRRARPAAR